MIPDNEIRLNTPHIPKILHCTRKTPMSLFVLAVGLAHGVPATLTGAFTGNRFAVALASLGMFYVAIEFGGNRYLAFDLIGVGLGSFFGWFMAKHATLAKQQCGANPRPQQSEVMAVNDILEQTWFRLLRDGAGTGLTPTQLQKRKEAFFTYFRMGICTGECIVEGDVVEIFYLAQSTGRTFRELYAEVLRLSVGDRHDAEEVIRRGLNNFDEGYQAEKARQRAKVLELANDVIARSRAGT